MSAEVDDTLDHEWVEDWKRSREDALLFVTKILNVEPEEWQTKALKAISTDDRVAIRSGHGVGKTAFMSWVVLWWLCTRYPAKILVTANSESQLRDVTWAEIHMWSRQLPDMLREMYEWGLERITLKGEPETVFASRRTASIDRPEALQGFHSEHALVAVEEASGISDILFPVMLGALSTEGSKMVMAGNPTRGNGYFYDAFHRLSDRFTCFQVSSEDVPRARAHIDDVVARFGRDSNTFRVRVAGEFPSHDDETVIPLHLCEAARKRDVEASEERAVIWGVDVARFGDDRSALAKRHGNVLLEPVQTFKNKDNMELAGIINNAFYKTPPSKRPSQIMVDVIGVGSGVVDRLREMGLPVRGVNVGESPSAKDQYMRLRDELWFKAREWLEELDCKMPDDGTLIGELCAPTYTFSSNGKLLVESKQEMKKRGLRSPDLADAFILTFSGYDRKATSWTKDSDDSWIV
jgi:hypothetical protein